jgi:sensor histidine kinase regulating citrate/malate metabolism
MDFTIRRVSDEATIDISLSGADNTYDIAFADTGPGLDKENKSISFKQLLKSPRTGPAGLGLYLLLSLVHTFGGQIYVEDRIPGEPKKGSRIVLTLKKG